MFATFTVTPERKEVVDFAEPYLKGAFGIVSPKAKPITDIAQLEGKTLIVNKGTSSDTYFTKHYPKVNLLKFERNSDAFKALTDGRGDAISQDSTYALAWRRTQVMWQVFNLLVIKSLLHQQLKGQYPIVELAQY